MASPQYTVLFSATVSGTGPTAGSIADVLIADATTGMYVKATTAARGTRRSTGIALSPYLAGGSVDIQQVGQVDPTTSGLGVGAASWVRCSTTGTLERVTPSGSDDVVGWVETDGTFHANFGTLTALMVTGSSFTAAGDLTGTSTSQTVAKVNGTSYPAGGGLTTGTIPRVTGASAVTYGALDLANASAVTGTLPGASVAASTSGAAGTMSAADKAKLDGIQKQGSASQMGALAIDWSLAGVFTKTLAAGGNTITFSNQVSGMVIVVRLTGAASTVTWPTVKWAGGTPPTQTTSGTDIYTFVHDGSNVYGSVVQAMA